jgi:hypothetical protein
MRYKITILTLLLSLIIVGTSNAFTIYTDEGLWYDAHTGLTIYRETFLVDHLTQPYESVVTDNGFISLTDPYPNCWLDRVTVFPPNSTIWNFSIPMTSFGGWFDLSPENYGEGLAFYAGTGSGEVLIGTIIPPEDPGNPGVILPVDAGFWGFITGTPFDYVRVTGAQTGPTRGTENYFMQNLVYVAAVPEPSTFLLLGAGLGLLSLWRRRK